MEEKSPLAEGESNTRSALDPVNAGDRDVEKETTLASTTQNASNSDIVDWEGEDDPATPMNWTNMRKFKNISVICYCTFLT
jgi:hypothetical protein